MSEDLNVYEFVNLRVVTNEDAGKVLDAISAHLIESGDVVERGEQSLRILNPKKYELDSDELERAINISLSKKDDGWLLNAETKVGYKPGLRSGLIWVGIIGGLLLGYWFFPLLGFAVFLFFSPVFRVKKYSESMRQDMVQLLEIVNNQLRSSTLTAQVANELKKCTFCAEMVRVEAIKCRFCQSELPPSSVFATFRIKKTKEEAEAESEKLLNRKRELNDDTAKFDAKIKEKIDNYAAIFKSRFDTNQKLKKIALHLLVGVFAGVFFGALISLIADNLFKVEMLPVFGYTFSVVLVSFGLNELRDIPKLNNYRQLKIIFSISAITIVVLILLILLHSSDPVPESLPERLSALASPISTT